MAMPQHHFHYDFQQQKQHQQSHPQSKSLRDLYNIDGRIPPPVTYFDATNLPDHPPYVPQLHVDGFAPGQGSTPERSDGDGLKLNFNYGLEFRKQRPEEQDFLENNSSQISSVDFSQRRSVSTGLGLSLDNGRLASSGDSLSVSLIGDDFDHELQKHDAEIDRFIKVQSDRLRQAVLEKFQANQLQTISYFEDIYAQKLREKEAELEHLNKKTMELEFQVEQVTMDADAWQQRAKYNENMINALKLNLQQLYAQSGDNKEGCGDSEVNDTAFCCNGRANDIHPLCKGYSEMKEQMTCKVCRVNQVCMLLLPCVGCNGSMSWDDLGTTWSGGRLDSCHLGRPRHDLVWR